MNILNLKKEKQNSVVKCMLILRTLLLSQSDPQDEDAWPWEQNCRCCRNCHGWCQDPGHPQTYGKITSKVFTRRRNKFAWFWRCGVFFDNRSVPSKSPTELAAGSWRQVARWWPSTSWRWLPPKERAQFCSQVTNRYHFCVVFWLKYVVHAFNILIREKKRDFLQGKKLIAHFVV